MKAFTRHGRSWKNTRDDRGMISIQISLIGQRRSMHTKGNIHRSLTVKGATVTEVRDAILEALFEEEEQE